MTARRKPHLIIFEHFTQWFIITPGQESISSSLLLKTFQILPFMRPLKNLNAPACIMPVRGIDASCLINRHPADLCRIIVLLIFLYFSNSSFVSEKTERNPLW
jgi:hypothetical protein